MDEGTLLEWLVQPGDQVRRGDIVAVVDTAKAAVEVESFLDGVVQRLLVQPGTTVPVGTRWRPSRRRRSGGRRRPAAPGALAVPGRQRPARAGSAGTGPPPRGPVTARRAAPRSSAATPARLGVDLARLAGTGPGGTITREDVRRAAAAPGPAPTVRARRRTPDGRRAGRARRLAPGGTSDRARRGRRRARTAGDRARRHRARRASAPPHPPPAAGRCPPRRSRAEAMRRHRCLMARSKREIPHYYLAQHRRPARALAWMRERNLDLPVAERLVPAALLLQATALAPRPRRRRSTASGVDDGFARRRRSTSAWRSRCAAVGWSPRRCTTPTSSRSRS